MVLSIVVWYDVVQDGMVMCGDRLELNGMMFYDMMLFGMISAWYGVVQVCMVQDDRIWFRTVWCGLGWYDMVQDGMVRWEIWRTRHNEVEDGMGGMVEYGGGWYARQQLSCKSKH